MNTHLRSIIVASALLLLSTFRLSPTCWSAMTDELRYGTDLYAARSYAEAIKWFERVAAGDPDLAGEARYHIGMCHFEQRMLDDAIPAFHRAFTVARRGDSALVGKIKQRLVCAYIEAEQFDAASLVIQQIAPSSPEVAGHLVFMSCLKQRDYEGASAALIYSVVSMPGVDHVRPGSLPSWLIVAQSSTQRKSLIDRFCSQLLSGASLTTDSATMADLVAMLGKAGRHDAASEIMRRTIADTDTPEERASKVCAVANIKYRGESYQDAASLYEGLLKDSNLSAAERPGTWYLLGLCYEKLNELESAKRCMTEIVTRFPDSKKAKWAETHLTSWSKAAAGKD